MAISATNSASVTGNTTSDWVRLNPGPNKVLISAAAWNGSTSVALRYSDDGTTSYSVRDAFSTDVVTTVGNLALDVTGPGFCAIVVTSYGSSEITVKVRPVIGSPAV